VAVELTGPEKAAILLLFMGEEYASEIFKKLDEREIRALGSHMSKIDNVPPEQLESLLVEYSGALSMGGDLLVRGDSFLKRAISKAVGTRRAESIIGELGEETTSGATPFERIKNADPRLVAEFIRQEHPQTIALIMAHMDHAQSSQVLLELPETLRLDVILRISKLDSVPNDVIEEIDRLLHERFRGVAQADSGSKKVGGTQTVAEILNRVDSATENEILSRIEEEHQELADEIRQLMFVFEDLLAIDDRGMMALMREVTNEDLTLGLKTASEELKDKILRNVSERARKVIEDDLETMGPVRLRDVEQAQQRIVRAAKKLEGEGKVAIMGKGGDDVLV
jgi:flagellar motor switch protein FliG